MHVSDCGGWWSGRLFPHHNQHSIITIINTPDDHPLIIISLLPQGSTIAKPRDSDAIDIVEEPTDNTYTGPAFSR